MQQLNCLKQQHAAEWSLYHGDCCELIQSLPDASIDFCIHSPPFSNLYIYSDSQADMGNAADDEEFFEHYSYLIRELFRVLVVGRLVAIHVKDLPKYANTHGTTGLIDFPGECIRAFEAAGFSYHSRVTIWKCPVTERERTNNNGLLHKTILRDRSQCRQGMADFLLVFRKPPEGTLMSPKPVTADGDDTGEVVIGTGLTHYVGECNPLAGGVHPSPYARKKIPGDRSIAIWQRYADPVWFDIDQTDVLNYRAGTAPDDERHICPLQLGLIRRAVQLWTNPNDVVLSPFAGIGSEGVGSIREGRRFVGFELKESYFDRAVIELTKAANESRQKGLF